MMTTLLQTTFLIIPWYMCCCGEPVIHTNLGDIRGIQENDVYQFRNIPYAKPPVGNLRFAKPEVYGPWEGVLDGSEFGPSCLQEVPQEFKRMLPHHRQSEDCLSLNVYTPQGPLNTASTKSVMVWIHGGAFSFGQAMYFDASHLALTGDIIVVTINYRLGVFGFHVPIDNELPGNIGLWDQRLALEWVHEHISSFGGNPKSVTLFGESAGSFSVCFHALNPMNSGLFHRVIAQSGVPTSLLTLWPRAKSFSLDVGIYVGCASNAFDESYLSCMRQIPAERLHSAQQDLMSVPDRSLKIEIRMGAVIDGVLIPDDPFTLMTNKSSPSYKFFRTLDFITGITSQDGSIAAPSLANIAKYVNFDIKNGFPTKMFFGLLFPALVSAFYGESVKYTLAKDYICPLYHSSDQLVQGNKVLDAFTDSIFVVPALRSLNIHSDDNGEASTYQYVFERPHPDPEDHERLPSWVKGSTHTSELFFLFGIQDFFRKYGIAVDPADLVLSEQMMKYWSNFAKTGNPNSDDLPLWEPYTSDAQAYISLDTPIASRRRLFAERVAMWEEILPNLLQTSSRYN